MQLTESFERILLHPITTASAVFAFAANFLNITLIDAVWAVLWNNAGTLFTVLSVSGFTLAPNIPWIPGNPLNVAALLAGALFVATQLNKLAEAFAERLDQ